MRLTDLRHHNVETNGRTLKPRGDMVLVRRKLELEDQGPNRVVAVDWQKNPRHGLKRGVVVAIGLGDKLFPMWCPVCWNTVYRLEAAKNWRCHACGEPLQFQHDLQTKKIEVCRADMNVKVGDEVLYWREPMNDVRIDNEDTVFLHEEQHLVAVLEPDDAEAQTS